MSKYGFVHGSKQWKSQVLVDSQLRTQLTKPLSRSSSMGNFFVRVRSKRLSEYGSIAYSVERPTRETKAEQYSDIVLKFFQNWYCKMFIRERKIHININKFAGLSRDWVGATILILCVFFSGHSLWGRKTHKQSPPPKSRDNPVRIWFTCFFSLCVFFRSQV